LEGVVVNDFVVKVEEGKVVEKASESAVKEVKKGGRYFNGVEVRLIKKDSERVSWWIGADSMLYKSNEGVFTLQEVENYKGIGLSVLFKKYFG
jgi:hypothetical protein